MKSRVIVAVIAIPLLVLAFILLPLWATGVIMAVISALSSWELLRCVYSKNEHLPLAICAAVCSFAIPLGAGFELGIGFYIAIVALCFALMLMLLMISFRKEEHLSFEAVCCGIFAGTVMPLLISSVVRLGSYEAGPVMVLMPFVISFCTDSGAYFVGCSYGKNKLAPSLSPNKTIEGSLGGFAAGILGMIIYGLIILLCGFKVNFLLMIVYGFLGALADQLGDLSFSAIKRTYGIKDYGKLLPGHGGMLDRFDSMFWTAPCVELMVILACAITTRAA